MSDIPAQISIAKGSLQQPASVLASAGASRTALTRLKIDSLRGLACLLLVAYHVVGDRPERGLQLPDGSYWHYFVASFDWLRMPLFTLISGYVYGLRRVQTADFLRFWAKKSRRILLPFIVVSTTYFVFRTLTVADSDDVFWHIFIYRYEHFWFLQALLNLFIAISIADALWRPGPRSLLLAAIGCAAISHVLLPQIPQIFGLWSTANLAPYFFFGVFLSSSPELFSNSKFKAAACVGAACGVLLHQAGLFHFLPLIAQNNLAATATSFFLGYLLFAFWPSVPLLALIGAYSYTIYLWHVFGTAGARLFLKKIGVHDPMLLFVPGLMLGILLPIGIHWLASNSPLLSWPLTGVGAKPRPSELVWIFDARQFLGKRARPARLRSQEIAEIPGIMIVIFSAPGGSRLLMRS
jgi:glucan biosynthesis protein C